MTTISILLALLASQTAQQGQDYGALPTTKLIGVAFRNSSNYTELMQICKVLSERKDLSEEDQARFQVINVYYKIAQDSPGFLADQKAGKDTDPYLDVWYGRMKDAVKALPKISDPWERSVLLETANMNVRSQHKMVHAALLACIEMCDSLKDDRNSAYARLLDSKWLFYYYDPISKRFSDRESLETADTAVKYAQASGFKFFITTTLENAARINFDLGNYSKTRFYAESAQASYLANPEVFANDIWVEGEVLALCAGSNHYLGNLDVAKEYYVKFKSYYLKYNAKMANIPYDDVGRIWAGYLFLLSNLRDFEGAKKEVLSGILLAQLGRRPEIALSLMTPKLYLNYRTKDYAGMLTTAKEARLLAQNSEFGTSQGYLKSMEGLALAMNGKAIEGEALAAEGAKAISDLLPGTKEEMVAIGIHFRCLIEAKMHREAAQEGARLFEMFKDMSETVSDPAEVGLFQQTLPYLHCLIAWNKGLMGSPQQAIIDLELGRAWGLYRQRSFNSSNYENDLAPNDLKNLVEAEGIVRAAVVMLRRAEAADATAMTAAKAGVTKAQAKLSLVWDGIFKQNPLFARKSLSTQATFDVQQLESIEQEHPDTLFIHLAVIDDARTLITANSDGQEPFVTSIELGEGDWIDKIGVYMKAAAIAGRSGPSRPEETKPDPEQEKKSAREFYNLLLGPLLTTGQVKPHHKRLVFITEGPLADLPLTPLLAPNGKRLIEEYRVSSAISMGSFTWAKNSAAKGILVVADPNGKGGLPAAPAPKSDQMWLRAGFGGPLPGAYDEGLRLIDLFKNQNKPLLQQDATEKSVTAMMGNYGILHFACHGFVESGNPLANGLVLCDQPEDDKNDGLLAVREISKMKLKAKLAVLSACETAQGRPAGGEGIQSLVWAFQAAGCPTVVASRWQVPDGSTRDLMVKFYENLNKKMAYDLALQQAILEVKKRNPDPRAWAPFEVFGDGSRGL